MKKIIVLSLCFALMVSTSGCSKTKPMEVDPLSQNQAKNDTVAQKGDITRFPEFITLDMENKEVTDKFFIENELTVVNLWATF